MSEARPASGLPPDSEAFFARQVCLEGFGRPGQERLLRTSVLVVGAGGLGCPALLYLTAAGFGKVTLVDPDRVSLSNLHRQVLYRADDVGRLKAEVAAERLRALNPQARITARAVRATSANLPGWVREHDLILDCTDNFPTRYRINDTCLLENRPFIQGAVQGFEGQVSVFNLNDGPTYRCLFPEPPPPGCVQDCATAGILGVLPGLVGVQQAVEAIKIAAGIGEPLSGRLWIHDCLRQQTRILRLEPTEAGRTPRPLPPDAGAVSPSVLREHLQAGRPWFLVDVRGEAERRAEPFLDAYPLPLDALQAGERPIRPTDRPTVCLCARGVRSAEAAEILAGEGWDAWSLVGGAAAWREEFPGDVFSHARQSMPSVDHRP